MRILFVLENYAPHIGGVEIVFKNLCEGLARRGHDVTVITHRLPRTKGEETINGVKVVRVRCMDSRYLFTFAAVPTVLRYAKDADVIHTTTFNAAPPAWLSARLRRKPVLITVHETWIGKWREYTDFSAPKAWFHELLERMVFLPSYDRYVGVSESTAARLREVLPKSVVKDGRVSAIHNGFDPAHWEKRHDAEVAAMRKGLGLEGKYVILGYGRPGTSKGFPYLVDAFHAIKRRIPDAVLLLILSKDRQYAAEIDRLKARAHRDVRFLEPQSYDKLPIYTQMADCIVIPSITEGFGYTTLESVASGTPVVASDTTSIPEVIWGKHVLVQPKDPAAIADAVVKVHAGRYNDTPRKDFPWERSIASYEKKYREMLQGRKDRKQDKEDKRGHGKGKKEGERKDGKRKDERKRRGAR